jgi:hypothetical protein
MITFCMMIRAVACQSGQEVAEEVGQGVDTKYDHMSSDDQGS